MVAGSTSEGNDHEGGLHGN